MSDAYDWIRCIECGDQTIRAQPVCNLCEADKGLFAPTSLGAIMSTHDSYKPIPTPEGVILECCPVCGSAAEIYRFSEGPNEKTETVVCCTQGDKFGPQTSELFCGCLLYLPSNEFHFSRMKQAVDYWNAYAKAVTVMRREK